MAKKYCKWTYDEIADFWDTACNQGQTFITGDIEDNFYIYCPYCGLKIREVK